MSASQQGRRTDLEAIHTLIRDGVGEEDIAEEYFSQWCRYRQAFREYGNLIHDTPSVDRRVYLLRGPTGTGKTRFSYEFGSTFGRVWLSQTPDLQWFDGYNGQSTAIIDDFRGECGFSFLLRVLDRYPLRVPIKGGFVEWIPDVVFITTNALDNYWYPHCETSPLQRRITSELYVGPSDLEWSERYLEIKNLLNL